MQRFILLCMRSRLKMAILSAVNLGGDADTVGACTGALAGAYWGLDAIAPDGGGRGWSGMMSW